MTASASWRGLIAAIACISVFGLGQAMSYPLISVLMERMGSSGLEIGLNTAAPAIAMLTGGPLMPRIIQRFGVIKVLITAILIGIAATPVFLLWHNIWFWLLIRFIHGLAGTAIFVGSEYWILQTAPATRRGLIVGSYAMAISTGFAVGPTILANIGTDGWLPFLLVMVFFALALIPIWFARTESPRFTASLHSTCVWRFFRTDPVVIWAVVLFGIIEFGTMSLIPVWGLRLGMLEATAIMLVVAMTLGNVVLQIPLGILSNHISRRIMLIIAASICVIAAFLLPELAQTTWPLRATLFIWGGVNVGLYTLAMIELGTRYKGEALVAANAALVIAYGIGALIAPPFLGIAMDLIPPHGLLYGIGGFTAAYMLLAISRFLKHRS